MKDGRNGGMGTQLPEPLAVRNPFPTKLVKNISVSAYLHELIVISAEKQKNTISPTACHRTVPPRVQPKRSSAGPRFAVRRPGKTKVRTENSKVRIVFPKVLIVFPKVLTVFRTPKTDGAQHRRDETRQNQKKAVQTPCALHSLRFLHPPVLPGRRPEGIQAG